MFQLSGFYCSGGCSVGKERKALALSEVPPKPHIHIFSEAHFTNAT